MADVDKFGRRVGNTLKDIQPGPMFNDWFASPMKGGGVAVQPGNEMNDIKAHNYLTQGGGAGMKEFMRPFDARYDYLQNREDMPLEEFDLMQAIRDRILRGQ